MTAKFPLGRVVATHGALDALTAAGVDGARLLERHQGGDWGDVCEEDAAANERDLRDGERLLSVYNLPTGVKLYIITEWDRSYTTIMQSSEY